MPASTPQAKNIPGLFDDLAELYDSFSSVLDLIERPFGEWMSDNLPKGHRALDIGCGAGRHTVMLADLYEQVVGVDAAPAMIEIAKRDRSRTNVSYQVRDVFDVTPEKDGLFDVVFAFSAVSHMAKPSVILPHLGVLVASGGVLVIFDPVRPVDYGEKNWHINLAFRLARTVYDITGQIEISINVIRTFTHKSGLELSERSVPLSGEEFRREYSAVLPNVRIEENIFPEYFTAYWCKPAS